MDLSKRAERFREAVKELGPRGRTTAYPLALREEAVRYAEARLKEGGRVGDAAEELQVGQDSLRRWGLVLPGEASAFRPVRVVRAATEQSPAQGAPPASRPEAKSAVRSTSGGKGGLVVHGPGGVRVEGLDVASVAELLRRLS
jgi:transposase